MMKDQKLVFFALQDMKSSNQRSSLLTNAYNAQLEPIRLLTNPLASLAHLVISAMEEPIESNQQFTQFTMEKSVLKATIAKVVLQLQPLVQLEPTIQSLELHP